MSLSLAVQVEKSQLHDRTRKKAAQCACGAHAAAIWAELMTRIIAPSTDVQVLELWIYNICNQVLTSFFRSTSWNLYSLEVDFEGLWACPSLLAKHRVSTWCCLAENTGPRLYGERGQKAITEGYHAVCAPCSRTYKQLRMLVCGEDRERVVQCVELLLDFPRRAGKKINTVKWLCGWLNALPFAPA